jgi:hypothetical protein
MCLLVIDVWPGYRGGNFNPCSCVGRRVVLCLMLLNQLNRVADNLSWKF